MMTLDSLTAFIVVDEDGRAASVAFAGDLAAH